MKVAFSTTDGIHIDEHFGRAGRFAVYEFTASGFVRLEDKVFAEGRDINVESTKGLGELHDDAVNAKVDMLADCKIIYLTMIGGPSAARLVRKGVMPIKVSEGEFIEKAAQELMVTIKGTPPPWMRKLI
jgi:nitrogen fixation protein NifX